MDTNRNELGYEASEARFAEVRAMREQRRIAREGTRPVKQKQSDPRRAEPVEKRGVTRLPRGKGVQKPCFAEQRRSKEHDLGR